MRALRYLLIALIVIVAAVAAIPFLVPPKVIADQVVSITREQTGRDLKLGGDISFSVYPDIAVSMDDVTLSNPDGMPQGNFLSTARMRLSLELVPLLSGNVRVKTFELVGPRINLLTDTDGRSNWDFGQSAEVSETPTDPAADDDTRIREISLDDIRIEDGIVRYLDERAGTAVEATQMNVALSLPSTTGDLNLSGSLLWRGEKVDIATTLGPVDELSRSKTTKIALEVGSSHLTSTFKGVISLVSGLALDGALDASTPSLRALAAWTGKPLAPGNGLEAFTAKSAVAIDAGEIKLTDARITLDGMRAQGSMTIDTRGARPLITGNLGVDQIDLNRYLAEGTDAPSKGSKSGWSDTPLDFAGLRAVNANLRMAASRILYKKVVIDNSELSVSIDDGKLNAKLDRLNLYEGIALGTLTLDGAASTPTVVTTFASRGVAALPLLRDFAEFDWLEGTSKLTMSLRASGASQKQLVESLNGTVEVLFEDGAIRGINIAQMMRSLGTDVLSGWSRSPSQKTDFASLTATYKVTNGRAVNSDLQMIGPLVRMTGGGVVAMPARRLDYVVDPKLVSSLKGQGGEFNLAGFNVPIKIEGPWSKPKIYPDIAGILDNPGEALKRLKGVGDIDPSQLGLKAEQIVGGSAETVEKIGEDLQDTLKDVLNSENDDDAGNLLDNVLKGLGNN